MLKLNKLKRHAKMGRSTTPKYRLEMKIKGIWQSQAWEGKPTNLRLAQYRDGYNQSLKKGGANEHLGTNYWATDARIVRQSTNEIVVNFTAPSFELVND